MQVGFFSAMLKAHTKSGGTLDGKTKVAIPTGHRKTSPGIIRQIKSAGIDIPREWN